MDEWIGAGDRNFQAKAKKRMTSLAENADIIVLASHNYSLLQRTCNKVIELEAGRVKSFEAAETWFARNEVDEKGREWEASGPIALERNGGPPDDRLRSRARRQHRPGRRSQPGP